MEYEQRLSFAVNHVIGLTDLSDIVAGYAIQMYRFGYLCRNTQQTVTFNDKKEIIRWNDSEKFTDILDSALEVLANGPDSVLNYAQAVEIYTSIRNSMIPQDIRLISTIHCQCRRSCHFIVHAEEIPGCKTLQEILHYFGKGNLVYLTTERKHPDVGLWLDFPFNLCFISQLLPDASSLNIGTSCERPYDVRPLEIRPEAGCSYLTITVLSMY